MAFKSVFIAHVPDADPKKHRCSIETGMYKFIAVCVKDNSQALEICRELVREEGIHSVILCPGNTHKDVSEIAEVVGPDVSISIARGDGPGMRVVMKVMEEEGWFNR
ncbi:MAG: DUF6506 family protein [bacterium]